MIAPGIFAAMWRLVFEYATPALLSEQTPCQPVSREYLLDLTQGREFEAYDHSIDVLISRIRAKLRA